VAGLAQVITIPYRPRDLQRLLHDRLESHRFGVAVCHRRFGKTVLAVNHLIKKALTCDKVRPRFAYIAPTYRMGKGIAWDYLKHFSRVIPDAVVNESELRVDFGKGRQIRIYGADNPDALRGIYLDGAVLDEFGLMSERTFSEVVSPTLSDRLGWAFFIGTPNGKNHFYKISVEAQRMPGWFFASYRASDTGVLSDEELATQRQNMTADEYAQEYECSFEASVKGAVYAAEMQDVREAGRVTRVPYESLLPVNTYWDLGIGDATAIWFAQLTPSGEFRLIDYYENQGEPLPHYIGVVKSKPYTYGEHWAPHDIEVREYTTGHSRLDVARSQNFNFNVGKRLPIEDGINAVRMVLPRCWFDAERTEQGREALQGYRYRKNTRLDEYDRHAPEHDWASHGADAFRLLALQHYTPTAKDIAKFGQRQAVQELVRLQQQSRMVGGTGETLAEAHARLSKLAKAHRDIDPYERKHAMSGRKGRGGYG
jgi:hypothetical protein